jgi:1-acyl-sn-glycerol-3-phosphate acyltransferase
MPFHDEGYGYDLFGLHPPTAGRLLRWTMPLYRHYFAVESHGIENIPTAGGAILIANHGGMLPIDAAMLWIDVLHRTGRYLRTVADRFVPRLPFVSTLFARAGVVSGTHANVRRLLEHQELLAVFPEGITGPAKQFRDRYELQDWRVGHAELAIRFRVPIIPVAIIGAEESWPVLARLRLKLLGAPYLPIPMAPQPLPVRFRIHYGRPIELHRDHPPADADDPACLVAAAALTRRAVADLVLRGLTARNVP